MFPALRRLSQLATRVPSLCAICHGWGHGRVCATCSAAAAGETPRCPRCALAVPTGTTSCGACLVAPPPYVRTLAAVDYAAPWDTLIGRFKFHAALDLAPALAGLIHDASRRAALAAPDCLLPMPLSTARLRERGYNQAWELARRLAPRLGCAADPNALQRVRDTPHQLTLPLDERAANVRGAFAVSPKAGEALRGRSVALVDDVMTTGATAAEAARTLYAAGVGDVSVWVVARTPRPGEA